MKKMLKKTKLYKVYKNNNTIQELRIREIELEEKVDKLLDMNNQLISEINSLKEEIVLSKNYAKENNFAHIFHDTIKNSPWFDEPLSLSSWAVGYPLTYILYKILDEIKPKSILELGLGQSSKFFLKYLENNKNVDYEVVESSKDWIEMFGKNYNLENVKNINYLETYRKKFKGTEVISYQNFKKSLTGKKFNLIFVDGPQGWGQEYARTDILDILPDCLEKSFIILFHDCERIGETNTINLLEEILNKNKIEYKSSTQYSGTKGTYICVSKDLDFLCSI